MKLDLNLDPDKLKKIVVILGGVLAVVVIALIVISDSYCFPSSVIFKCQKL